MKIIAGAVPKTLVEIAVKEKKDAERSAKRKDNGFVKYDEVWVVFDVDTHPSIAEAKQQAAANGVHIAISNPCFELWAVLHFRDQNAHLDTAAMRRLCGECIPGYGKRLPCSDLMKQVEQAIARAEKLRSWHESRGTPGANPSTNVDELVGSIRQQRAPR